MGSKLGKFHIVVHRKKFHKRSLNVLTLGLLKREKWWTNEQKLIDMIEVSALPVDATQAEKRRQFELWR